MPPDGLSRPLSGLRERKTPGRNPKQPGRSGPSQKEAAGQTEPGSRPKDRTFRMPWESSLASACAACPGEWAMGEEVAASRR